MKKIIITTFATATLLSTVTPSVLNTNTSYAAVTIANSITKDRQYLALNAENKAKFAEIVELNELSASEQLTLLREMGEVRGISPDGTIQEGKIKIAYKTAQTAWKYLPKSVKSKFKTQGAFWSFLKAYEHFDGTIEKGINRDLRKMGFSSYWANVTTKIITFFIL